MTDSTKNILQRFVHLIDQFLSRKIDAPQFEEKYLELWRTYRDSDEHARINALSNNALDRIFTSVDCYCKDEDLRDEGDLDENQLYAEVQNIFSDLMRT